MDKSETDKLGETIERIRKRGAIKLTNADVAALRQAPTDHEVAQKMLAAHAFNRGEYALALHHSVNAWHIAQTPENESNLVATLVRMGRYGDAIARLSAPDTTFAPPKQAQHLAEIYSKMGDTDQARLWGTRAITLKDAAAAPTPANLAPPILHRFDPETPTRNIIAFSLFGADPRYSDGALRNAIVAPYLFPGWTTRFYVDDSVPEPTKLGLPANGAQLREVPTLPAGQYGLFWRFLVEDDPAVDLYLIRDADSVLNIKDRAAVDAWLASDKPFHLMRDFSSHCDLVLAGLWGAHRGNLPGMGGAILRWTKARKGLLNDRAADQKFLGEVMWPKMRGRTLAHDSAFGALGALPFPATATLPAHMHVGQDDSARREAAKNRAKTERKTE